MRTAEEELLEGRHHTLDLVDVVEDAEQSELESSCNISHSVFQRVILHSEMPII